MGNSNQVGRPASQSGEELPHRVLTWPCGEYRTPSRRLVKSCTVICQQGPGLLTPRRHSCGGHAMDGQAAFPLFGSHSPTAGRRTHMGLDACRKVVSCPQKTTKHDKKSVFCQVSYTRATYEASCHASALRQAQYVVKALGEGIAQLCRAGGRVATTKTIHLV